MKEAYLTAKDMTRNREPGLNLIRTQWKGSQYEIGAQEKPAVAVESSE